MGFIKVMKAIFGGIFSFLSYIFISLGLWLPAIYSIVYFVICGATETTLAGGVLVGYFVGLGITVLGGMIIAMLLSKRRKKKEESAETDVEKAPTKKEKKKKDKAEAETAQTAPPPQFIPYPQYYPYPYPCPPSESQQTASQEQYQAPVTPPQPDNPGLQSYQSVHTPPPSPVIETEPVKETVLGAEEALKADGRTKVGEDSAERPMVFRTRRDPNVFVCEYHDRFQYWRRTRNGMVLERTEYKGMSSTFDGGRRR